MSSLVSHRYIIGNIILNLLFLILNNSFLHYQFLFPMQFSIDCSLQFPVFQSDNKLKTRNLFCSVYYMSKTPQFFALMMYAEYYRNKYAIFLAEKVILPAGPQMVYKVWVPWWRNTYAICRYAESPIGFALEIYRKLLCPQNEY